MLIFNESTGARNLQIDHKPTRCEGRESTREKGQVSNIMLAKRSVRPDQLGFSDFFESSTSN